MIVRARQVASHLLALGVFLLAIAGFGYWLVRCVAILSESDAFRFADNAVSGVRFSRYIDLRPPGGRVMGMNAYAEFLAEATKLISSKRGGSGFVDQPITLEERAISDSRKAPLKARLLPISEGGQVFGIQASVRFKLLPGVGDFTSIRNRWVALTDRAAEERLAFLERIDDRGVAWIRGELPLGFYPTAINIYGSQRTRDEAIFTLATELTHAIRGGVVTSNSGRLVVVRQLPYANKIPLAKQFKYRPLVGDVVRFRTGSERRIDNILTFQGNFLLELDRPIDPYLDSNDDIIRIVPQEDNYNGVRRLLLSSLTDGEFFAGRERFFKVSLDLAQNRLSTGDFIIGGPGEAPYMVARSAGQEVSIDLLETALRSACARFDKIDNKYEAEIHSEEASFKTGLRRFGETCREGQPEYDLFREILQSPRPTPEAMAFLADILRRDGRPILAVSEIFNRGLDMQVSVYCAACKRDEPPAAGKLPAVEGAGDIWEIYPGSALNLYYGDLNKSNPEMIIHALGKESAEKYYATFAATKPSFVAIAKPRQFTPWLVNWHWSFFETLLLNYKEYYSNSDFSLWYRDRPDWVTPATRWESEIALSDKATEVVLPVASTDLSVYTVALRYEVTNPLKALPLVGKAGRLLVQIQGAQTDFPARPPVSLPLDEKEYSFPVFVKGGASPTLKLHLLDPFGTGVQARLKSVTWRALPVGAGQAANLLYYAPPYRALMANGAGPTRQ